MFSFPACGSFPPESERGGFEFSSHQGDDLTWSQSELSQDGVEACAIFPGHLDDAIDLGIRGTFLF